MKNIITIICICLFQSAFCQQGSNYLKLMNDLTLVDSTKIRECFKNGKPKKFGVIKCYKYGDFFYEMNVGKHTRYYKGGSRTISYYDNWGTNLINQYYDSDNNLISESTTTVVETNASNLDEFLNSRKHITYNIEFKDYRYDYELCKYYLKRTGQYSNSKKVGVWKYFYPSGELKKEKTY